MEVPDTKKFVVSFELYHLVINLRYFNDLLREKENENEVQILEFKIPKFEAYLSLLG